ncbi:hypothetical protein Hanom_Chr14g01266941 [Helianthus anomalus]
MKIYKNKVAGQLSVMLPSRKTESRCSIGILITKAKRSSIIVFRNLLRFQNLQVSSMKYRCPVSKGR